MDSSTPDDETGREYEAMHSFTAAEAGQLSFHQGDRLIGANGIDGIYRIEYSFLKNIKIK